MINFIHPCFWLTMDGGKHDGDVQLGQDGADGHHALHRLNVAGVRGEKGRQLTQSLG